MIMENSILKDKTFWLLLIFASIYILGNIGTGSLTTHDEAIYANVSREILDTGDWLVLHDRGEPWFDKPPLYMWMTACFYKIFGINEFATRLTSGIFGVAAVLLMYMFIKKIYNRNVAIFAALILLAMPHYLHFTKLGMMDVPITFFILLMIYFFWIGQEKPVYLFFSGAVLGLAYLMKGFAAFLGPVIIFAYCIFSGSWRHLFKRQFIMGTLFAFVIIFLWHLILYCLTGPEAIKNYFGFHIFSRATSAIGYHTGGINFYQKAIFNKNKPWSVLVYPSVFYILWQALKKRDSIAILILSWIAASYVLYSVITTKLHWYIIPIYPALALSTAIFLERFFKNKAFKFSLAAILIIMLIQVPISWAFKIDFNPDVKKAAGHAKELKDNGSFIYFYKKCDNKELFYYRDFSMLISDKNIPSKDAISSGKIYCIIRLDDIKQAERECNYIFQPVRYSGDIAIARIRNKEN